MIILSVLDREQVDDSDASEAELFKLQVPVSDVAGVVSFNIAMEQNDLELMSSIMYTNKNFKARLTSQITTNL